MKAIVLIRRLVAVVLVYSLFIAGAHAQATRTWVSGVGDDANPCSRTAPCKTFAGAISKTAAGGAISVLDPGGFGAVTITKSITIETDGQLASILSAGTNGIIVNAGVSDRVILRNIAIEGAGTGLNGIRFIAGGELIVEGCTINGVTQKGISFEPTGTATATIVNTRISNANDPATGGGIAITPGASGAATVSMTGVRVSNSQFGIQVNSRGRAFVRDTMATMNTTFGFDSLGGSGNALLVLDNVMASGNGGAGFSSQGSGASTVVSRSVTAGNGFGFANFGGGNVSFSDNRNTNNTTPGAPNSTTGLQ